MALVTLTNSSKSYMDAMDAEDDGCSSLHGFSSMICDEGCFRHCSYAACCNREHEQAEGVSHARRDEGMTSMLMVQLFFSTLCCGASYHKIALPCGVSEPIEMVLS